jgi:hypothetical protein
LKICSFYTEQNSWKGYRPAVCPFVAQETVFVAFVVRTGVGDSAMEDILANGIQFSLANKLFDNAIFLAERLVAQNKSEQSALLLATCFYETKKYFKGYQLLKDATSPSSRYLGALCASQLNKLVEAQGLLLPIESGDNLDHVANGAAGLHLLGTIFAYEIIFQHFGSCFPPSSDKTLTVGKTKEAKQ